MMGVPENTGPLGPSKKRQRLSLKSTKNKTDNQQKLATETKEKDSTLESASKESMTTSDSMSSDATYTTSSTASNSVTTGTESTLMSSSYTDTTTSSSTDLRVPAIASLENLGNTCFMNSIMQVLRYTPGFLENLVRVYQHIQMSEKIKKKVKPSEEPQDEREAEDQKNCWNVAKSVFKVYKDQSLLEEKYEEVASSDGMSMAVKPIKILQAVRIINPMFEGFLQHDAQEFLRCFLAYMQDAEKEIKKFSIQIPKALPVKAVVNPVMQRFLQSAKSKGDKQEMSSQDVMIKGENSGSCDKTGSKETLWDGSMDKAKMNLISKLVNSTDRNEVTDERQSEISEPEKPTNKSPVKNADKMLPKIGNTAENILGKESDDVSGLQTASMDSVLSEEATEIIEIKEGSRTERLKNRKLTKGHSRKGREYSPYKKSQDARKDNKTNTAKTKETVNTDDKKLVDVEEGNINLKKKLMQPSLTDMLSKTYSKSKRLGMSRSVTKRCSAESLFDAVKDMEKSNDIKQEDSCRKAKSPSNTSPSLPTSEVESRQDNKNSKESAETMKSKSDGQVSFMSMYSSFLSALKSGVDDTGETCNDDDEEEKLIREKKVAKILHESPRRSPRKATSQMVIPSPALIYNLDFSKSESDIKTVKSNLKSAFDSVPSTDFKKSCQKNQDSDSSRNSSQQTNISNGAGLVPSKQADICRVEGSPDRIKVDCDISFRKQSVDSKLASEAVIKLENCDHVLNNNDDMSRVEGSPCKDTADCDISYKHTVDSKLALEPVIKLENCDYVFKNNETTVSAMFANKCLSPFKRSSSEEDCSNGNYLKQRNLGESIVNKEEMEKALEAMFNSPAKSNSNCDFIEQLFQGSMMLRTRCLLCETSTERLEDFHDISVPVRLERDDSDDEDENKDSSMEETRCSLLDMIKASTEPEKLQNDNKYYCSECEGYMEAEHSIHYDVLPDILTLHLKRFLASSGNFGYISKINDAVDIPMILPCLRYKCPQSCLRPDHKYKLYGIITHTGVTLSSGHYLAYARARPHTDDPTDEKTSKDSKNNIQNVNETQTPLVDTLPTTRGKAGIAPKLPSRFDGNVITNTKVKTFANVAGKGKKGDLCDSLKTNANFAGHWFECDDECIRVFEESEFMDLLSEKQGSLLGTPYLLFYHKYTIC